VIWPGWQAAILKEGVAKVCDPCKLYILLVTIAGNVSNNKKIKKSILTWATAQVPMRSFFGWRLETEIG
jgi:hypothetical protein